MRVKKKSAESAKQKRKEKRECRNTKSEKTLRQDNSDNVVLPSESSEMSDISDDDYQPAYDKLKTTQRMKPPQVPGLLVAVGGNTLSDTTSSRWPTRDSAPRTSFSSFTGGCLLYLTGE